MTTQPCPKCGEIHGSGFDCVSVGTSRLNADPAPDNAQQGAREGEKALRPSERKRFEKSLTLCTTAFEEQVKQLAAKDAEIDRLTSECLVRRQEIADRDTLIAQMLDALRVYRDSYSNEHTSMEARSFFNVAYLHGNKAISAAETMMEEKTNG